MSNSVASLITRVGINGKASRNFLTSSLVVNADSLEIKMLAGRVLAAAIWDVSEVPIVALGITVFRVLLTTWVQGISGETGGAYSFDESALGPTAVTTIG